MKKVTLTQLEETVLTYIADTLSGNFGEGYSDVDHAEIAKKLELEVKVVKGVVTSLVKKELVYVFTWGKGERGEGEAGGTTIHIQGQEDCSFEEYTAKIKEMSGVVLAPTAKKAVAASPLKVVKAAEAVAEVADKLATKVVEVIKKVEASKTASKQTTAQKWASYKAEIEANLDAAKITDKALRKLIITFYRRIETTRNRMSGGWNFETVCNSAAHTEAIYILDQLSSYDGRFKVAKYAKEWAAYCKVSKADPSATVGDHLA